MFLCERKVTGVISATRSLTPRSAMLLLWGTLQPHGSSKLASVRFSGPVRIRSIRVYPKGASLFSQNPEVIRLAMRSTALITLIIHLYAAKQSPTPLRSPSSSMLRLHPVPRSPGPKGPIFSSPLSCSIREGSVSFLWTWAPT